MCVVLSLCASEVSSYISVFVHIYRKASKRTIATDYVPIVIQTACSWDERPILCHSPEIPGLSRAPSVPCFSWVGSSTSTPCSPFCDPDSLFTSCAISVFIFRPSTEVYYTCSSSTSSNTSCTSHSSFSNMLTNKLLLCFYLSILLFHFVRYFVIRHFLLLTSFSQKNQAQLFL